MNTFSLSIVVVILIMPVLGFAQENEQFVACKNAAVFKCADKENMPYPFWGTGRPSYCGHPAYELNCTSDAPVITISDIAYRILAIDEDKRAFTVAREDYSTGNCPADKRNATSESDLSFFEYSSDSTTLTLFYKCPVPTTLGMIPYYFNCTGEPLFTNFFGTDEMVTGDLRSLIPQCETTVVVRVSNSQATSLQSAFATPTQQANLTGALNEGFKMEWNANNSRCEGCIESGGQCGSSNSSSAAFSCYCKDGVFLARCGSSSDTSPSASSAGNGGISTGQGLSIAGACLLGMSIVGLAVFLVRRRKKRTRAALAKSRDLSSPPSSKSDIVPSSSTKFSRSTPSGSSYTAFSKSTDVEKGSTYFGTQVFSYDELEEATDNFDRSRELGEGGFGTVYYGKLADGREVAVKRLYENNFRRVEQFMNEVEILTRLQHHNLVKLYGCTSRRSRELLLVYEFVSNGTVADHLHVKETSSGLLAKLSWPVRLSIAAETAEALAYLHRSDIIHRDVKTNNILLDAEFRVKVADFGLSKLFPNDVTHVSTAPQGTPGYVDPEYYQCYQLTTKSDVYSFGVVLIELISSLQAVDTNRHRHDINLANMAVNKVQNHLIGELVDPSLGFDHDESVRKMATDVAELAFRCLQQERDMRPSMEEVLAALRAIQKEEPPQKPDVVDITADDIGLLKNLPPPLSPDSDATGKWPASDSTTPNSY